MTAATAPERAAPGAELGAVTRVVRDAVVPWYGNSSCIVAVRVLIAVLRHRGVHARPLPVSLLVLGPVAARAERAGVDYRHDPAAVVGRIYGTGHVDGRGDRWDGHLVALADLGPAGQWLADPSLDQMHRPGLGLYAEVGAWRVPPGWPACGGQAAEDLPGGGMVVYEPIPDVRGWRDAPGWRSNTRLIRQVTAAAVHAARKEIPA